MNLDQTSDNLDDQDSTSSSIPDNMTLTSLPDIPTALDGAKHLSIAEQISATSLEKLRKLKYKLSRALTNSEGSSSYPQNDETETSPLVLASPANSDLKINRASNLQPSFGSELVTPTTQISDGRASRPLSPSSLSGSEHSRTITSRPLSPDKETPV